MDLATAWSDEWHPNGKPRFFLIPWLVYSRNAWVLRVKNWDDVFLHESNETRIVSHVADPLTCAKPATLDRFWTHIAKLVVIKRGEAVNSHTIVVCLEF